VEKVLYMLHQQHQAVQLENKPGPSYLAIAHVRDQLIAPAERQQKARLWAEVVEYIRHQESRVREEIQHVAGDEFRLVDE
jgi:Man1-Src1p-C-terminal domain